MTTISPAITRPRAALNWRAFAVLGLGILFISWSAIFVKWANVPGAASGFYRVFIAALILFPAWLYRTTRHKAAGIPAKHPSKRMIAIAILGGLFFAADLAMYNTSVLLTSAANATLLGNNAPLGVALGAWLVFAVRPKAKYWIGLVIAMLGTFAIVGSDLIRHPTLSIGDLFAFAAAMCFAGYLLAVERVRATTDTLTLITITVSTSALALLMIALIIGDPLSGYSANSWTALIGLGLVCQVGGYLALTYALGHLPATVTSVCLLIQAPLTAILAVPLLGESISAFQIAGGALVLSGIYIVNRGEA